MEYTNEQLERMVESDNVLERIAAVQHRVGLDKLINDALEGVRREVALQGYGLDILLHDESWRVREIVARCGYGFDVLINDSSWEVRWEVAKQGYGLDRLMYDEAWQVRAAVAEQGYGLETLMHDDNDAVRIAVRNIFSERHKATLDETLANATLRSSAPQGESGMRLGERDFLLDN